MKKSLIIAAALSLLCNRHAEGQATYYLDNRYATIAPVFDSQGVPLQGPIYVAELWGGATANSLTPALAYFSRQRIMVPFLTGIEAGFFRDSYAGRDVADHPTIFAVPGLGDAWLEVRAWDTRLGPTYEEVVARGLGGYGESSLFYAQGGVGGDLLRLAGALEGLQSFSLLPVIPEPGVPMLLLVCAALFTAARTTRRRHPK